MTVLQKKEKIILLTDATEATPPPTVNKAYCLMASLIKVSLLQKFLNKYKVKKADAHYADDRKITTANICEGLHVLSRA